MKGANMTSEELAAEGERISKAALREMRNNPAERTEGGAFSEQIDRLAALKAQDDPASRLEYERLRKSVAESSGARVAVIDELVAAKFPDKPDLTGRTGRVIRIDDTEPFGSPVDGAELFDDIEREARRFVSAEDWQIRAAILWAVHTHCYQVFNCSPRIIFDAPNEDCGKTACLRHVFGGLANRGYPSTGVTVSPFFRLTDQFRPTWLIDEADVFLKLDAQIFCVLNEGFEPGGEVPRCTGENHETVGFQVFGPVAMAGCSLSAKIHRPLLSRSVVIHLQRASAGSVEFFEANKHRPVFARLRSKVARWVADNLDEIKRDAPIPEGMTNRNRMKWTPFLQIARAVSDTWHTHTVNAWRAELAEVNGDDDAGGKGVRLLSDVRAVFCRLGKDRIETSELIAELAADKHGPWADYNHRMTGTERHITPRQLANLLKGYRITPAQIRTTEAVVRGYRRESFTGAWTRYLPTHPPELSATRYKPSNDAASSDFLSATSMTTCSG